MWIKIVWFEVSKLLYHGYKGQTLTTTWKKLCGGSATDIIPFDVILYLVITEWLITSRFIPLFKRFS